MRFPLLSVMGATVCSNSVVKPLNEKLLVALVVVPVIAGSGSPPEPPMLPEVRNCRGPALPKRIAMPDSKVVLAGAIGPIGS